MVGVQGALASVLLLAGCSVSTPDLRVIEAPIYIGPAGVPYRPLGREFRVADLGENRTAYLHKVRYRNRHYDDGIAFLKSRHWRVAYRLIDELEAVDSEACGSEFLEVSEVRLESRAWFALLAWADVNKVEVEARVARVRRCSGPAGQL